MFNILRSNLLSLIVAFCLPWFTLSNYVLNQTGGSFPNSVYLQTTFSYNFVAPSVSISYYGPSSAVGKCNIMGYWHTSNADVNEMGIPTSVKNYDKAICTDKCTASICGYTPVTNATYTLAGVTYTKLTIRPDSSKRLPLTDFGASDGLLGAADYLNFPDLQMLPAVAGAVVPIYNIPEFLEANITTPLILSRSSLVNIFMGKIKTWNDPSILADNFGSQKLWQVLRSISQPISIVVRTDSSGTSQVFTSALDAMSPVGYAITPTGLVASTEGSFHNQICPSGPSQSPFWCGPLTDELQYITVTGCNRAAVGKTVYFKIVDHNYNLQNVSFNCDSSAAAIRAAIFDSAALDVHVALTNLTVSLGESTVQIEIGYKGLNQQGKNWYTPILISYPIGVSVAVSTKQEGGYLNTVTTCTGKPSTIQTQSIWILTSAAFQFSLAWTSTTGATLSTSSLSYTGTDISSALLAAVNSVAIGAVTSAVQISRRTWTEFRLTFSASTQGVFSSLQANTQSSGLIYVDTLLDFNNYPCFYDSAHPTGYAQSGRYTCYRRQSNFTAFSYYSGNSNLGVVAEVINRPYTIGYSVLEIALSQALPTASMINKAGAVVVASSQSVAFAIMDKGGNLNSLFQASLADGSSSHAWPISGFTYFIIRNKHHISSGNCARRSAAMEYLYNFYNSPTVEIAAQSLGFAVLPQFIAGIIVQQLVNFAKCDNGQYALAKYRISSSPLYGASAFQSTMSEYVSAYTAVDPSAQWQFKYSDDSSQLYNQYINDPAAVSGVFSMFSSKAEKIKHYNRSDVLTSSFANIAVVPLYHLNAYTNSYTHPLRITAQIIGGILAGKVSFWNDSLIQAANPLSKAFLPYQSISVVVRSLPSDTNGLLLRFLNAKSATFQAVYAAGATSTTQFNFSAVIPSSRLLEAITNDRVDSLVTTNDGSFGYYLQYTQPVAAVASYCADPTCATGVVDPSVVTSITACEADTNTVVNPRPNLVTYDMMSSTALGCYPIVGTVDYSLLSTTDSTCKQSNTTSSTVLKDRIRFGSWLFSSPVVVQPLVSKSIGASPESLRQSTYKQICDIACEGSVYGYLYCGYRDCSWAAGDYKQVVSDCDPLTERRSVTYELISPSNTCIRNPLTMPSAAIIIGCSAVLSDYQYGKVATALAIIGMVVCAVVMLFVVFFRHEKIIKKSQPVFIYIFITGAFLMNLSILAFIGPNDDHMCLLRPWAIDISTTIMFAPLLMKLHRIDILFRLSKKLKKTRIPDYTVALHVLGLVSVDIFILLLWTFTDRPVGMTIDTKGGGLYAPVLFTMCSTDLSSPFERAMVAWKALLLAGGVYKSICTWDMPADIAEVKHFFLAIYNVSVVGGAMYFFSLYGSSSTGSFVILRCVGIFVSATLPVLIIMVPKFMVIQYKIITGKNLWMASKNFVDNISSNSRSRESYQESATSLVNQKEVRERIVQNLSSKVAPDSSDTPDLTGVGSAKTHCSSGSRKQSLKAKESSFKFADRVANGNLQKELYGGSNEDFEPENFKTHENV